MSDRILSFDGRLLLFLVWHDAFRGLPLLLRGGTTPEGGSIFSEDSIMHLEGSALNTRAAWQIQRVLLYFLGCHHAFQKRITEKDMPALSAPKNSLSRRCFGARRRLRN